MTKQITSRIKETHDIFESKAFAIHEWGQTCYINYPIVRELYMIPLPKLLEAIPYTTSLGDVISYDDNDFRYVINDKKVDVMHEMIVYIDDDKQ